MSSDGVVTIKSASTPPQETASGEAALRFLTDLELAGVWQEKLRQVRAERRPFLDVLRKDQEVRAMLEEFRRRRKAYEDARARYAARHRRP